MNFGNSSLFQDNVAHAFCTILVLVIESKFYCHMIVIQNYVRNFNKIIRVYTV